MGSLSRDLTEARASLVRCLDRRDEFWARAKVTARDDKGELLAEFRPFDLPSYNEYFRAAWEIPGVTQVFLRHS